MYPPLSYLVERVRVRYNERKPVMGASDDNREGHWLAKQQSRIDVLGDVLETLEACGDSFIPLEAVRAILEAE